LWHFATDRTMMTEWSVSGAKRTCKDAGHPPLQSRLPSLPSAAHFCC